MLLASLSKISLLVTKQKFIYIYSNLAIIFIFSIIYWTYGTTENLTFQESLGINDKINYTSALYYSFITHSSIGYGDITPKSIFMQRIVMCHIIILSLTLLFIINAHI